MNFLGVLKKPLVTEKSYKLSEQQKYVFVVFPEVKKTDVKQVFEMIFNVKVQKVNILKIKPKPRRIGRFSGYKKGFKKAVITLLPGQKLDVFSGSDDKKEKSAHQDKSFFDRIKEQFLGLKDLSNQQSNLKKKSEKD